MLTRCRSLLSYFRHLPSAARHASIVLSCLLACAVPSHADYISFGASVTNLGNPNYSFTFSTPVPSGAFQSATATLDGTLTDAGTDGVSVTGLSFISTFIPDIGSPIDLGVSFFGPCTVSSCSFSAGNNLPVFSAPGTLSTKLSFTLSGGSDQASFKGRIEILPDRLPDQVPEPASLVLLATGASAGLARFRRGLQR